MTILWRGGEFSVRDVHARLARPIAYTTVMTTLDRLYKKGVVSRRRERRAFLYTAAQTRDEFAAGLTGRFLKELLSGDSSAARPFLSNLVDVVSAEDAALLDELERLVRDKRQRRERSSR
jgi:predicted transcriptional regulator